VNLRQTVVYQLESKMERCRNSTTAERSPPVSHGNRGTAHQPLAAVLCRFRTGISCRPAAPFVSDKIVRGAITASGEHLIGTLRGGLVRIVTGWFDR
jgi:hypothetical protein